MLGQQRIDPRVYVGQPSLGRRPGGRLDHAAVERDRSAAALGDDAVAGVGKTWVDAEDDHSPVILRPCPDACRGDGPGGRPSGRHVP